jgi:hypothetical protein
VGAVKVHAYFGFFVVGGMLLFLGLVLLLAVPAAGLLTLLVALAHLLVGAGLRARVRRRQATGA